MSQQNASSPPCVIVSGASGLVGSALTPLLTASGYKVIKLVRRKAHSNDEICWNPDTGVTFPAELNVDAVFHLAGENIGDGRWTKEKKWRIKESRIRGTSNLCESLLALPHRPKTLICSSAVGFYGNRGDAVVDERSGRGLGFLAEVCEEWEQSCQVARDADIRVVNIRTGVVLSPKGGVLKMARIPFSLCLGGPFGNGSHYMSWIALTDLINVMKFCLENSSLQGPVNAVSPHPITNLEFTKTLAAVLNRPAFMKVPYSAAKLLLGEMADEVLFSSTRAAPKRLTESGYQFQFTNLESALRHLLKEK